MTQKEKFLLLQDLCTRLPYGIKYLRESWNYEWDQELSVIEVLEDIDKDGYINNTKVYNVEDIKPYLRPISSMTEEEALDMYNLLGDHSKDEIRSVKIKSNGVEYTTDNYKTFFSFGVIYSIEHLDWLNAHYFDYRGLIDCGLAIEVTKENNPYE